jgi:hypothetical protein
MKKRLTVKDIEQLSDSQKQNLTALWMPEKYDVAVASICKDITTEEYEIYEFVVGKIDLINGRRILLHDIKSMVDDTCIGDQPAGDNSSGNDSLSSQKDADLETEDTVEEDLSEDEFNEDEEFDMNYDYSRPTSFMKDECYPLLSIGQMIEILQKSNTSKSGFYMTVYNNETSCEIGTDSVSIDRYEKGFSEGELFDLLWESVKSLL